MRINFLTRRRMVLGRQVQEPTLLALALTVTGLAVLLGVCVVAMAGLPAFDHIWWTFAAVTAVWAWLVLGLRKPKPGPPSLTGRRRWLRRIHGLARLLFIRV